ncbi:MAG: DNA starvation/stationary phase protection protein [Christensenellaceae bacterium]|nr:DNA starvation/stationary phase protection protein [Christensenellaceae bacterium]
MEKLNVYLADLVGAHAKLQNMHWNVVGEHFKMVHEYTETIYRQLYEYIDKVAEYMVMNGKRPFASLKDFAENTTIAQLKSEEYKAGEVVRYSLAIVRALKESAHEIHEETECYLLQGLLEEQIASYSKHIWFLNSMIQPSHR